MFILFYLKYLSQVLKNENIIKNCFLGIFKRIELNRCTDFYRVIGGLRTGINI